VGNVLKWIVVSDVLVDGVECRRFVNIDGAVLVFRGRCRVGNLPNIVGLLSAESFSGVTI
jgi:hypothetical protein